MAPSKIEYLPIAGLKPWARNARTHSRKQVRQIADSIRSFGFTNPVLIDDDNMILAGHGRVEAAKLLGTAKVPCVRIEHMTPTREARLCHRRQQAGAQCRLGRGDSWPRSCRDCSAVDLDFDIGLTGFSIAEIDSLIEGLTPEEPGDPADDVLPDARRAGRCRPGDLWQLGPHRLICGDALDPRPWSSA